MKALCVEKVEWQDNPHLHRYAYDPQAIDAALSLIFRGAEMIHVAPDGAIKLSSLPNFVGINIPQILELVRENNLWLGSLAEKTSLSSIYLIPAEIIRLIPNEHAKLDHRDASELPIGLVAASEKLRVSLNAAKWLKVEAKVELHAVGKLPKRRKIIGCIQSQICLARITETIPRQDFYRP